MTKLEPNAPLSLQALCGRKTQASSSSWASATLASQGALLPPAPSFTHSPLHEAPLSYLALDGAC